jgi:hypothetical protein
MVGQCLHVLNFCLLGRYAFMMNFFILCLIKHLIISTIKNQHKGLVTFDLFCFIKKRSKYLWNIVCVHDNFENVGSKFWEMPDEEEDDGCFGNAI